MQVASQMSQSSVASMPVTAASQMSTAASDGYQDPFASQVPFVQQVPQMFIQPSMFGNAAQFGMGHRQFPSQVINGPVPNQFQNSMTLHPGFGMAAHALATPATYLQEQI